MDNNLPLVLHENEAEDNDQHDIDESNHYILVLSLLCASLLCKRKAMLRCILSSHKTRPRTRAEKWYHERLCFSNHVEKLEHEGMFERTYRMSLRAFRKLIGMLGESITLDHRRSGNAVPILPEIVAAIGLRWLAGGNYIDIRHAYGCSVPSIFRLQDLFIDAVLECKDMDIVFPESPEEIRQAALKFQQKSTDGIMRGCVGAIDGMLAVIKRPNLKECGFNPGAYFSGHYMTHGLNIQGVCDCDSRFIFFGVMAPGKCSDQVAFERTSLPQKISTFPPGYYLVGDAAYQVSDVLLVPFTGAQRENKTKDAFNFFLSQLRIRIEMAFGLLQTKWAVLQKPLVTSLSMSAKILEACARLHNYCISEGVVDMQIALLLDNPDMQEGEVDVDVDQQVMFSDILGNPDSPLGWGYLPTVEPLELEPGTSVVRDVIVGRLGQLGMHRPSTNVLARQVELHDINLM
jgi:hypothetical protein